MEIISPRIKDTSPTTRMLSVHIKEMEAAIESALLSPVHPPLGKPWRKICSANLTLSSGITTKLQVTGTEKGNKG